MTGRPATSGEVPPARAVLVAKAFVDGHEQVVGALVKRFGDPDLAQEATAEAFARALDTTSTEFSSVDQVLKWTHVVARNVGYDALRTFRRHESLSDRHDATVVARSADEVVVEAEDQRRAAKAFAGLSSMDQTLLSRRVIEGSSVGHVAAWAGMTNGSARVAIARARHRLRTSFERIAAAVALPILALTRRADDRQTAAAGMSAATVGQGIAVLVVGSAAVVVAIAQGTTPAPAALASQEGTATAPATSSTSADRPAGGLRTDWASASTAHTRTGPGRALAGADLGITAPRRPTVVIVNDAPPAGQRNGIVLVVDDGRGGTTTLAAGTSAFEDTPIAPGCTTITIGVNPSVTEADCPPAEDGVLTRTSHGGRRLS